jgi:hypothetical protein
MAPVILRIEKLQKLLKDVIALHATADKDQVLFTEEANTIKETIEKALDYNYQQLGKTQYGALRLMTEGKKVEEVKVGN